MQSSNPIVPRDLIIILTVIVIWGLNFVPMIFALRDLTPLQLGVGRFLMASLPFIWLVPRPKYPLRWLLFYAATQGFGQFMLLFIALTIGMPAGIASLLMQVQAFFTALMGVVVFGEVLSRALKLGLVVSAIGLGCFVASLHTASDARTISVLGLVLTLVAAAMWAVSNIVIKKIHTMDRGNDPLSTVIWAGLISGLMFLLTSLLVEASDVQQKWLDASWRTWLSLLYLGVIANGLGYWVWASMLARYPASRVAPFSLGVPVVGMVAGIVILGESVTALQWLGAALIMSALVFVVLGREKPAQ